MHSTMNYKEVHSIVKGLYGDEATLKGIRHGAPTYSVPSWRGTLEKLLLQLAEKGYDVSVDTEGQSSTYNATVEPIHD